MICYALIPFAAIGLAAVLLAAYVWVVDNVIWVAR
jgi:hypothetical protein